MASGWRLVFHLTALLHHLIIIRFMSTIDWEASNSEKLVRLSQNSNRFFTIWNFLLQTVFLICSVLCDVGELKPGPLRPILPGSHILKKCAEFKDFLFSTFLIPLSISVAVLYWSIYWYDPELVGPEELDLMVPSIVNHSLHTFIVLVVALELLLGKTKRPREHVAASMLGLAVYITVYYIVLFGTYLTADLWLYKIFEIMTWLQTAAFFICHAVSLQVFFFIGLLAQELAPVVLQEEKKDNHRPKTKGPGKIQTSKRHVKTTGFKWDAFR